MPWRDAGLWEVIKHIGPAIVLGTVHRRQGDPDAVPKWFSGILRMILPVALGVVSAWVAVNVMVARNDEQIKALGKQMEMVAATVVQHRSDSRQEFSELKGDVVGRLNRLEDRVNRIEYNTVIKGNGR